MRRLRIHWPRLRVLFGKEILDLARDKKVVVAALLLPTILFPSLLFLSQALFSRAKSSPDEGPIRVGISGTSPFLDRLVRSIRGASWATNCAREDIADGSLDAILRYERAAEGAPVLTLLYDSGRGSSRVAAARLEDNLKRVAREIRSTMLQDAGIDTVSLPARNIVHVDTAPVGSGANRHYARLLPMLLVLVLVAAVSFAAIDLFPGERERGTLETLLVQPLRTGEVVTAKFLAIFAVSTAAIFANLTGLWAMSLAESEVGGTRSMSPGMLGVLFLLSLPLCLLISACLVRVVARAQTVREGQHYLLPLTMFCLLPPFLAGSPHVPFDMFTAILPIAGAALAFREASLGNVPLLPVAMMLLSTTVYSLAALGGAAKHLSTGEGLLVDVNRQGGSGRALLIVLFSIMGLYSFSPLLSPLAPALRLGLPVLLFVALPLFVLAKWAGMPPRQLVAFEMPRTRHLIGAVSTGVGLAMLATCISRLQADLLPMPESFLRATSDALGKSALPIPVVILVMAVIPAVFEELLYRRLLLERMARGRDPTKGLILTSVLFGLHHLSVFRFFPSLAAGLVLGNLVLRTKAFWTAPIAHATSNALIALTALSYSPLAGSSLAQFLHEDRYLGLRLPVALLLIMIPMLRRRSGNIGIEHTSAVS